MSKAILYDSTVCIDCKLCEKACAERNKLPYNDAVSAEEVMSAHKLTFVMNRNDKFMRRLCMNCQDPTCASVCPVGALRKTAAGPVVYDESRCIGCRYCMLACPFGVPKYEWSKLLPRVRKCDMCADRIAAGRPTACAEACPTGATKFGERDELIAEARGRIAKAPGQYVDHIYGLEEVGGTSVLLLSSIPFAGFGLRAPNEPLPILTYRVLSELPEVVSVGGLLMGGIWWITNRRSEVADAEAGDRPAEKGGKSK
ncbi:MAG TPA: 4Fe-4S dicluster domain-containing protein [Terriglobia bacterium]|nr:4Fe-4S dicluster domain-containing protein [Terriglobia bacterium]